MVLSMPSLSHLLIAISFMFAYMLVADYVHLKTRFAMKRFIAWLFLRPYDLLFLMRLRSIEKHIRYAVDNVSFDMLNAAKERIRIELQYRHTKKEAELINELSGIADAAEELMKDTLIAECHFGL